jgi:hypothetical protein
VALECDWAHHASIGGGGLAGGGPRRAAAVRSRRRARCGLGSGEARGGEDQCAAMGARG